MDYNDEKQGGASILTIIQVVFIVLKALGLINWSWWAVLTPLWISLGVIIVVFVVSTVIVLVKKCKEKKERG